MSYNYQKGGMPDFHASATDISGDNAVHDVAGTVGSPNPTTPNFGQGLLDSGTSGFMQGGSVKSGVEAAKNYAIQQGVKAAAPVVGSAAQAAGGAIKAGASALLALL